VLLIDIQERNSLMLESSEIYKKLSSIGECLTKDDFISKKAWKEYINNLEILEYYLLDSYTKQHTKQSNRPSPFSVARNKAIECMQQLSDFICDLAMIDKINIDKWDIYYAFRYIKTVPEYTPEELYLSAKLLVKPQVVFESILYYRINNIKYPRLNEPIEKCKKIGRKTNEKNKQIQNISQQNREVDFTSENEPVIIYVYFKSNSCQNKKHNLENVTALIRCQKQQEPIKINVCFCKECLRYFILDTELIQYQKQYGVLFFKRYYDENYLGNDFQDENSHYIYYRKHSELWLYGYNVQEGNLSVEERQNLLMYLINKNLLSKSAIISSITRNIKEFEFRERYRNAVLKWKEDLAFIQNYKIDEQRHVIGKLVRE